MSVPPSSSRLIGLHSTSFFPILLFLSDTLTGKKGTQPARMTGKVRKGRAQLAAFDPRRGLCFTCGPPTSKSVSLSFAGLFFHEAHLFSSWPSNRARLSPRLTARAICNSTAFCIQLASLSFPYKGHFQPCRAFSEREFGHLSC